MRAFLNLCIVITLIYYVSSCELDTHYEKEGRCCKMCGPGKRMLINDDCEDPRCQDCPDGEYQKDYTIMVKCDPQPICDTNLHFLPQKNPSKTHRSECKCKPGYHCTSEDDCDTCRKNKVCQPGQRLIKHATPQSDTVCEACKNGTFSTQESSTICHEWKVCEPGFDETTPGTLTSDRVCEKGTPYMRTAILSGVVVILFVLVAGMLIMYLCKKRMLEWCKKQKETVQLVEVPGEDTNLFNQQPQEDIDPGPVSPTPSNMTENGNLVRQEDGKHSLLPSYETHPCTENTENTIF